MKTKKIQYPLNIESMDIKFTETAKTKSQKWSFVWSGLSSGYKKQMKWWAMAGSGLSLDRVSEASLTGHQTSKHCVARFVSVRANHHISNSTFTFISGAIRRPSFQKDVLMGIRPQQIPTAGRGYNTIL